MDEFSVIRRRSDKSDGSERYKLLGCYNSMLSAEHSLENLSDIQKDDIIIVCDTAEICDYYNHKNIYIVSEDGVVGRCRNVTKDGIAGEWEGPSSRAEVMLFIAIGADVSKKYIILACVDIFDDIVRSWANHDSQEVNNISSSTRAMAVLKAHGKNTQISDDIGKEIDRYTNSTQTIMDRSLTIQASIHLFGIAENMSTNDCGRLVSLACYATGKTSEDLSDVVRKHIPLRRILLAIRNKYTSTR